MQKMYLQKFNASDSDYLEYGFGRVKLDDWYQIKLDLGRHGKKVNVKKS